MDTKLYFPLATCIGSYMMIDKFMIIWLFFASISISLFTMLCEYNKISAFMYFMSYMLWIQIKNLNISKVESGNTSIDKSKSSFLTVKQSKLLQQINCFLGDVGLHILFLLGLLWKYGSAFNMFTVLSVIVITTGYVLHVSSHAALDSFNVQKGDNDNFLKYWIDETKSLVTPVLASSNVLTSESSDDAEKINPVTAIPTSVKFAREIYIFIIECMWRFYTYVNKMVFKKGGPPVPGCTDPYHQKMGVEEMHSCIQSNITKYSMFSRGNITTLNCLALLLNFWAFNGIAYLNNMSKVLLTILVAPAIYFVNKTWNIDELLAKMHIRVDWWSVVGLITLCYSQVNIVWVTGLIILTTTTFV